MMQLTVSGVVAMAVLATLAVLPLFAIALSFLFHNIFLAHVFPLFARVLHVSFVCA